MAGQQKGQAMKPNILFLFYDQHRADAMGCAGHAHVKTRCEPPAKWRGRHDVVLYHARGGG